MDKNYSFLPKGEPNERGDAYDNDHRTNFFLYFEHENSVKKKVIHLLLMHQNTWLHWIFKENKKKNRKKNTFSDVKNEVLVQFHLMVWWEAKAKDLNIQFV